MPSASKKNIMLSCRDCMNEVNPLVTVKKAVG